MTSTTIIDEEATEGTELQDPLEQERAALAPELYTKPSPSSTKAALFGVLVVLAVVVNLVGGVLIYAILSRGEILSGVYNELAGADLSTYVGVMAGIVLTCVITTGLAYLLSLDFRRVRRPAKRIHLLASSFVLALAGAGLGALEVSPIILWPFLAAAAGALLLGAVPRLVELGLGSLFARSAARLLRANAPVTARGAARAAMRFRPSDPHIEQTYGLAMALSGRTAEALPYLLNNSDEIQRQPLPVVEALAAHYEAGGKDAYAVMALEELHRQKPSASVFERLMKRWLAVGRRDEVLHELQALPPDERRQWHDTLKELVFERGDLDGQKAYCREVEQSEGPPYLKAEQCYRTLLEQYPDNTDAYRSLIELARRRNDSPQAAQLLETLVELEESPNDRRDLVAFYWSRGDRANMLRHLTRINLSGHATLEEKQRILDEHFADGDYASVEEMVRGDETLNANARALFTLANSLWQGNRLEDALDATKQAREFNPDDELTEGLDSLEKAIKAKNLTISLEVLSQKVKDNPKDLDLRFEYYDKLVPDGKVERVVLELEDLLTKHPEHRPRVEREIRWLLTRHGRNFRLLDYLGDLYMRDGDFDRAFELYEERVQGEIHSESLLHESSQKVLDRAPDHKPALLAEVRYHFNRGTAAEALGYLDRYVEAGGETNPGLQELEFEAAQKAGELERAERVGKAILEQTPEDVALLTRMATIATELLLFDDAKQYLQRAQKLDPENHHLRLQLRSSEEKRKRTRIEVIREFIAKGEANDDLHEELGDLYYDFGQLNEAMAEYQRSSHGSPDRHIAKAKLGFTLSRKGMHPEAEEVFTETELKHGMPEKELQSLKALFYSAGQLMEEDGEDERALAIFRRVFRVDAGYKDVVGYVERLQQADRLKKKKRY